MARKRKIPARKHHGIRDPLKQLEIKAKKLKNAINHPPEMGNDQKISYKFAQFKKLADDTKAGKKLKRLHAGLEDQPRIEEKKNNKTSNKLKRIKQLPDESDRDYLRRVNRLTTEALHEAEYEAKYGVRIVHDPKTGEISIKKKEKNEIDELLKKNLKKHNKRSESTAKPMDPKLAKALIKQAIREDEEEKKVQNPALIEYKKDVIKFGEIVHGPPILSTLPRKATKSDTVPRPGSKSNLLLKALLCGTTNEANAPKSDSRSNENNVKVQLSGRRKDLPLITRQILENEQSKAIEIYRQLKKSKERILT